MEPQDMSQNDWELNEDYYQENSDKAELKLEDFMDDEIGTSSNSEEFGAGSSLEKESFQKIVNDVHQVLALAGDGKTIDEIVRILGLERQYVYDIQVSAQGFREDDEVAVAHLVEMSL